ncbi:MAG TPA: molybdate ABC transporter substrate-binding protein [Acidobacteriota bacterium]|nr:molybdate ABC transporter substrate-binding protein [Acidobacteriota bacterium]
MVVYAAASLRDVMQDLSSAFQKNSGTRVLFNFAGSNVLAQQIEASPEADVFLSANEQWMDFLQEAGRIETETRRIFASNRLVIIAHRDSPLQLDDPAQLAELDFRYLSLADPEAVPAGRYARQYLQSIDPQLWKRLESRVAPAPDVRAALALVEADPQILGIVYRTDSAASQRVKVLYQVPPERGPHIRYPAALIKNAPNPEQGKRFLEFLRSPEARGMLEAMGFGFGVAELAHRSEDDG